LLDPVLVFELLQTSPLAKSEAASLLEAITQRVENTEAGLLQAWALRHIVQQPQRRTSVGSHRHHCLHSQFVAELAAHIARETGYPAPDEAYAAGLLHDIGLLWLTEYSDDYLQVLADTSDERALSASEWERYGQDHAEISSSLAARCGLPTGVADAIALHQADAASLVSAHPLVRIAAAAEELASYRGNQAPLSLEAACRLTQLDGAILVSLLADTTRTVQDRANALGIPVETTMFCRPWSPTGNDNKGPEVIDSGIARAALGAFTRSSFSKGCSAWTDFSLAARLLICLDAPVLFVKAVDSDELTGAANPAHPGLSQIRIAADDQNSVIAEAYRDAVETRFQAAPRPPGRSAADWQLARWLESDGLLCVPWSNGFESGVAVFPCPSTEDAGEEIEHTLRQLLTNAATLRISERNAEERLRHEIEENVGRRYVDHARRIAHEASNPLTVIKTYLGIIDEKVEDATLKEQLNLLSDELDRVGALIRKTSDFTGILPTGPAHSGVAEILHDLRALYGEALFARRGIHFELRTSPNLPAAAIPPDALKQVLLNLFKNAAEAIPEGGKLTVSAVAGINANGSPCLEVRVVDNGPGMSPERVQNLFAGGARNSTKPGGGVGLPVVRDLVTNNGGTILCRSQLGSGTVFQIFMPLAA
jgi:putative nucleotidyltransferase with HDIG domain